VEDLDEEELARGYPRAEDGSFRCPPNVVPRSLHNRMVRELFDRANRELKGGLVEVAQYMMAIVRNEEIDPKVRLSAAQWVFERVMGKVPDVQLTAEMKRYEMVFEGVDRSFLETEPVDDGREP
jgi:hypothetical protein